MVGMVVNTRTSVLAHWESAGATPDMNTPDSLESDCVLGCRCLRDVQAESLLKKLGTLSVPGNELWIERPRRYQEH